MIFRNDLLEQIFARLDLLRSSRSRRIDDRSADHLAGRIYHGQLTARTECRIPAKHYLSCDRRLHKKLLKILSKYYNCSVLRFLRKFVADLPLDGRCDQPVITVLHRLLQNRRRIRIIPAYRLLLQISKNLLLRRLYFYIQELFLFPSVQRQDPMPRQF